MMIENSPVPGDIIETLRGYQRVLIVAHANPDGDAMGSSLAMARILLNADINALVFNESGMPGYLSFLTLPGPILTCLEQMPCDPQLVVVLDCSDRERAGRVVQPLLDRVPVLNIDHHPGNTMFGTAGNWVDPGKSSTGELVALIAREFRTAPQGALGEALYVAMSSDTGNFSYGNTTAGTLRLVADIIEAGVNIARLREKLDNTWSEARFRLWGRLMQETRLFDEGRLAAVLITRELLRECGAAREDCEGFVEQLRRIAGVRVSLLLREEEVDGKIVCKASLRSSGKDNVREVAVQFGGGGHRNAAGATVPLSAEKTLTVMHPYIRFVWNRV